MPEQIISASGTQYGMVVNPDGSINTTANVSLGSVSISAGSETYIKGGSVSVYGTTAISGIVNQGTNPWIVLGSVAITSPISVSAGSESYIKGGSIQPYNPIGIGSIRIAAQGLNLGVLGSVNVVNTVAVSGIVNQGTSPWVISGTVTIDNRVAGSIVNMPNIIISTGSIRLLSTTGSSSVYTATYDELLVAGSITSMPSISVSTGSEVYVKGGSIHLYSGTNYSNVIQTTTPWAVSGIVNLGLAVGSVSILSSAGSHPVWQVSGTNFTNAIAQSGTSYVNTVQQTNPWIVLGSVAVSSPISVSTGSEVYVKGGSILTYNPIGIGSIRIAEQGITLGVSGIVNQGTNPWVVLGSTQITNPVVQTEQTRGVFDFSGASFIASGTMKNISTPGAGSKIMLKGFSASAETPTQFRLLFSGGTTLGRWALPSSGTIMFNFLGMEPSGALNQPISIGLFNAGSLHLTVFKKDTL